MLRACRAPHVHRSLEQAAQAAQAAERHHPAALHHFGSREALVKAVTERALNAIDARMLEAIASSAGQEGRDGKLAEIAAILDGASRALTEGGHARVLMWLALEGPPIVDLNVRLAEVVDAVHALRRARSRGKSRPPSREDTAHAVVLAALALQGLAVIGPTLLAYAGLSGDAASVARFRGWLARLLAACLEATP
jgi:AcrR family transcriptional regulator